MERYEDSILIQPWKFWSTVLHLPDIAPTAAEDRLMGKIQVGKTGLRKMNKANTDRSLAMPPDMPQERPHRMDNWARVYDSEEAY